MNQPREQEKDWRLDYNLQQRAKDGRRTTNSRGQPAVTRVVECLYITATGREYAVLSCGHKLRHWSYSEHRHLGLLDTLDCLTCGRAAEVSE